MDYSTINELGLDEWSTELKHSLVGQRYPLIGMFELTDRCNLGCVHCYINQAANCQSARDIELSTDQIKHILNQICEAGCLYITFTGGEVLLRPDFTEIYLHARRLGMLVTVFTNGTLLTPRIADVFAQSRPKKVEITLYGATRDTYEQVTGVPGSFNRCMNGIDLLLERKIPLNLKSMVLTINIHELPMMRTFAEQRGFQFRYDGNLWPRLDGSCKPYEYRLSAQQLIALDDADPKRQSEWERLSQQFSGGASRAEYVFTCGAGLRSFNISTSGQLSICGMARQPSFDLLQTSFVKAWNKLGELRELKRAIETKCRTCTLGVLCGQCPGWSQVVHGDNETPVDFLCELAHLRANRLK